MAEEDASSAKVKFLCSHGGKILPRPTDGHLKYVGGETRVLCVPRSISFSDLMEKIKSLFEGDFVIKYQIGSEELDALVSVKSDEDLQHMFDEYDRVEKGSGMKLRSFLFPAKLTPCEIHSPIYPVADSLEQRFVDAVNGFVRPTNTKTLASTSRLKPMSATQSECTSPRSPSPRSYNSSMHSDHASFNNSFPGGGGGGLTRMNRVHSSPSLCTLANQNSHPSSSHNSQHPRSYYPSYQSQHQHQYQHQQYHSGHHPCGKPPEHHGVQPWPNTGRDGFGRVPSMSNLAPPSHSASQLYRGYPGNGGHNRWVHHAGKPPVAYSDGSSRSGDVSPTNRGIIWE